MMFLLSATGLIASVILSARLGYSRGFHAGRIQGRLDIWESIAVGRDSLLGGMNHD